MRIEKEDIKIIKDTILKQIPDAKIKLFGSRIDDSKKGGDIDIFVESLQEISLRTRLDILTEIELAGVDRKVDIVIKTPKSNRLSIYDVIEKEGVELW